MIVTLSKDLSVNWNQVSHLIVLPKGKAKDGPHLTQFVMQNGSKLAFYEGDYDQCCMIKQAADDFIASSLSAEEVYLDLGGALTATRARIDHA